MVESLPQGADRGALESAAKKMLGIPAERRAKEPIGGKE
jgi:hypothetical protein